MGRPSRIGRLALVTMAVLAWVPPAASGAVDTGISDRGTAFFDDPAYTALGIDDVRLVVPWNAGLRAGPWHAWLDRATGGGARIMVALDHDESSRCPAAPCALPAPDEYAAALGALLARHPAIGRIVPWNEPNHGSQPTARRPERAADYYRLARARCPWCVVVAGNLLDDDSLPGYLNRYRAALPEEPPVWGLHNYNDVTSFSSRGVDLMLRETSGALWLTETGGIVRFTAPGAPGLPYDEQRAADGLRWLYQMADARPRLQMLFLYQWQQDLGNGFDAGLLRADGARRPAYDVLAARLGVRVSSPARPLGGGTAAASVGSAGAAVAPSSTPDAIRLGGTPSSARLRIVGRRIRLLRGRVLALHLRCISDGPACRTRLVVRVGGERHVLTVHAGAGAAIRRRLVLGRATWRRIVRGGVRSADLRGCDAGRCGSPARVALSRPLPRSR